MTDTTAKKKHLSPSQISMYARCGESYRRRYVSKEIIPPSIALHKGTSVHKGAERNFKQKIETRVDLPAKQVREIAVETLKTVIDKEGLLLSAEEKTTGKAIVVNEAEQSVLRMAGLYIDDVAPKYQPLIVEGEQRIAIPDSSFDLLGRLDLVDDKSLIVDLKTGGKKKNQSDADESIQFTTYGLTHRVITGNDPAGFRMEVVIDKKVPETQTLETTRTRDDFESLVNTFRAVAEGIEKAVYIPAYGLPGAWWCSARFCGFHATCKFIPANRRGKE